MTEVSQDRLRELLGRRVAAARQASAGIPRGAGDGRLSPVQRRMWLAGAAEPDNPAYNVPVVLRLRGPLDVPALEAALADLAARHEVLHSRIVAGDGEPRAVPGGAPSVAHERIEAAELGARVTALVERPFRPDEEIPFRPTVLELGDEDHALVLIVHHLAVDAGSLPLLVDELAALYRFRTGDGPALDPPSLQYGDAAAWLNERAASPAAERALDWWTERLAELDPAPVLAPVPRTGWSGAEFDLELDAATVAAIRDLARGGSVFMVLLAALQVLLARIGDPDVAVGVPEAGRRHPDLEGVMGCFIETLVVRDTVDLDATGRELIRRARTAALDAVGHAEVPFDRVAERVAPGRPLFGTLLNVVSPPHVPTGFPGLSAEVVDVPMTAVKAALTWTFIEDGPDLRGRLAYRTDVHDDETARRLAGWFTSLLTGLAADPDRVAGELPLEPGADHVLSAPAAAGDPRAVHERFLDQARLTPDAGAVVAADGGFTYAELADRARHLAERLHALGVGRGGHVGVLMERTRDLPVALLGVLIAGAAYVPVDETAPTGRVAKLLSNSGVVIASPSLAGRLPSGLTVLSVDGGAPASSTSEVALPSLDPADPAYVIYTSGSTGTPKRVVVGHGNLAAYLDAVARRVGRSSSYALVSTIAADLGLLNVFGALTTGATLHLLDLTASTDPALFADGVRGVETFKCVPSQLEGLAAHAPLSSLLPGRLLVLAGEAVPWSLVDRIARERPDLEVQVHYGPTETTVSVLGCAAESIARESGNVPLGTPFPGVSCFVADAAGRPLPRGVPGELWIGGPQVARGGLHRSGDRARVRPDGLVEFLGRIDDQVKVRGHRVDPGEVAAACRAVPGVAEAVVLGAPEGLAAWLVAPGLDEATVRRALRRTLPDAMVPSSFTFLDALPLTVNGKIDRARLPAPVRAVREAGALSSAAELLVAEVWGEVLGVTGAGAEDDFFALGGDSFSAVRAAARFAERLGSAVPPRLLFDHPVVADLARELESLSGDAEEPIPRRDASGPWPLTPLQRRLWLVGELDPESTAYNVPVLLRLRGDLDLPALRAAVSGLARRHEMLRTRVVLLDGEPHGITGDPVEVALPVEHLEEAEDLDARLAELTARPFALAEEPPFRATLLVLGPQEHVLVLLLHHIASDASSRGVLLRDLAALYSGHALSPLDVGFPDIAAWQHGRPASSWWTERLADLPPELDLPSDGAREDGSAAGFLRLELGEELVAGVRSLASDAGATVFMVLLTALQATLARVSGSEDVAVAVPEAGRRHRDAESVLGCLLDTLVVRTRLDGVRTGRDLLTRVRGEVLEAFAHAAEPFEPPPLQVLLNLYQAPGAVTGFAGLAVEALETLPTTARFDLSWTVQDDGSGLRGGLTYRRDLFDDGAARRIAGFFTSVLTQLVATPDGPLDEFDLEPGTDPILAGPPVPSASDEPIGLHERIERHAVLTPSATAVEAFDGVYSYSELDGLASALAARLTAAGVDRGDRVAVLLPRSRDLPVALLGVLKARAAFVPLDDAAPADRIAAMCATADVRVAVTTGDLAEHLPRHVTTVAPSGADEADGPAGTEGVTGGDLAYVIFTSGSTGTPKGVAVEHGNFATYLDGVLPRVGTHGSWALVSTIAADLGMLNVFGALATGGTLHLFDRDTAADPEAFAARVKGVDFLKCVPSHLELLASHGDLASVLPERLLVLAGEAVPWSLVDLIAEARPELEVQVHYGPTETTVAVLTCTALDELRDEARGSANVPLGRPLPGVRCLVADAQGRPQPHGLPGELWIGGPQVARGYLQAPDFGEFYRSGDRARVRPDGVVEFLGRIDDQVKIRGYRVEPGEVAAVCRTLPGVTAAVVLAVGTGSARRLAAWLVADGQGAAGGVDAAEVRGALRSLLPDYMVPSTITFLPALPLNPNGKVDRARLPMDAPEADFAEPESEAEKRIAQIWADLLGLERVGADDDFFALGGDSFLAVKAVQAIDPDLRVIDLVTRPTVRELAARLGTTGEAGLLHRLSGPRQGTATATIVCVPYGGGSAAVYRPLAEALPDGTEVLALELPGHDPARPDEPLRPLEDVVDQCVAELAERTNGPIAVYGHCVGSALATALALRLEETGVVVTGVHVGGSFPTARLPGRLSAWFNRRLPADRWLSDRAYRDALRSMGGLPEDLDGPAVETAVRAIRHDARQAQDWFTRRLSDPRRLRAPLQVIVGESDGATDLYQERHREWEAFSPSVSLSVVPLAGHYFLRHQPETLASFVAAPPPAQADPPPPAKAAKKELRGFHVVAAGQLASMVGSSLSSFALGVWTYQRSGRVLDFALVTMLALLPAVLAGPLGGAVADRHDRRKVMLACDALSGLAMAVTALLLWRGGLTFAAVCGVVTLLSVVSAFHRPAYLAAVAQLVPKPYLPQANALAQAGLGLGTLVAPLAGGALIGLAGLPTVVAVDVGTFAVALLTLAAVPFPDRMFHRRDESFRSAIAGGWRFITRRPPLMVMAVYFMGVNYFTALTLAVVSPMVLARGGAVELGVVTAAGGLGAVLGSVVMARWSGTRRLADGMVGFVAVAGLATVVTGLAGVLAVVPLIAFGLALRWGSTSVINAHWLAIIQLKVRMELQGRVLSTNQMLATAMTPLGYLSTAPLAAGAAAVTGAGRGASLGWLLTVMGVLLTGLGLAGFRLRRLRRLEDLLPDALPTPETSRDLDELQEEADRSLTADTR